MIQQAKSKEMLGVLLQLYLHREYVDPEFNNPDAIERSRQALDEVAFARLHDWPAQDGLPLLILENLDSSLGIRTVDDLCFALVEFSNFISFDETDVETPIAVAEAFLRMLRNDGYRFSHPVGRTSSVPARVIGGRCSLQLAETMIDGRKVCLVQGLLRASHWTAARQKASDIADEFLGLLSAVGVAQFQPSCERPPDLAVELSEREFGTERDLRVEHDLSLSWQQRHRVWMTHIAPPRPDSDLEAAEMRRTGSNGLLEKRMGLATRAFSVGGPEAKRLRQAGHFLRKAETADSPGDSFLFMATCLEGLLLEKGSELSGRLADSVAFLMGNTHSERKTKREIVKKIYEVRSEYVHTGVYKGQELERLAALDLTRQVIKRELRLLEAGPAPEGSDPR